MACPWIAVCVYAAHGMLVSGVHVETYDHLVVSLPVVERVHNCLEVAEYASKNEGVDTELAIAVAWTESRFNAKAKSKAGAMGLMQVIPKFHCDPKEKECDLVEKGVSLLERLKKKYGTWSDALCHYASGNVCRPAGERYARKVLGMERKIRRVAEKWDRNHCN